MHIVAQSFRKIDEPLSSTAPAVFDAVIDEFDDECMDDNDEMQFFGNVVKPGAMELVTASAAVAVLAAEQICRLFSNECNDDDDDVENITSADVSSSVNGSERVR